jgi:hypothetical protein
MALGDGDYGSMAVRKTHLANGTYRRHELAGRGIVGLAAAIGFRLNAVANKDVQNQSLGKTR